MTEDVYKRLRVFLDRLPAGFPETPTGVEIKLLKKMFTPEQAALTLQLKSEPETVPEIAGRTGLDQKQLAEDLEQMAKDGLIFRIREGEVRKYMAFQFIVGLYEFQLHRMDREFCELVEEYMPFIGLSLGALATSQLRVIPVESALKGDATVAPYNRVRELVGQEEIMAVANCICKKEQGILDNPCSKPIEVCMMFGKFAQYYMDNNNARAIDKEEAFRILDLAEANGLVLNPSNTQKLEAVCCCCSCCCPTLKNIKMFPNPGEMVTSYYRSVIDGDLCTGCGECAAICPMDAIEEKDGISAVLTKRCIGCGLCVDRCPVLAISMEARKDRTEAPPKTFEEVMGRMAAERGL
ncbi:MAG: 4Fe-4S binding protein [Proteobacteria bacterium]|nr:4Fe-4S binding protein [Pseudomonadota bacterium]MBU4471068.1 4Fe-4S binding protein [Pseudomonadota bacterium]MCG2753668.1 4Fe-4S binding protein [Desulfobacteraceae bacterium]